MKKTATWILVAALLIFIIDWGVMGIKIIENDYNITVESYIGAACIVVIAVCCFCRIFGNKCPHCGKIRITDGDYCSYCGKKIEK